MSGFVIKPPTALRFGGYRMEIKSIFRIKSIFGGGDEVWKSIHFLPKVKVVFRQVFTVTYIW